jgi:hypothetical protein
MKSQFVQDLQERVESEVRTLEKNIKRQKNVKSLIKTRCSINSLKSISIRLKRIKSLLDIKDYNLVFIGKIGVGKTTAICHLFNLFHEQEKTLGKTSKVKRVSELLSTGSGRTTICEVVLQPSRSEQSFLEIEPYSNDEIKEFIREASVYLWSKVTDQNSEVTDLPPAELLRAIRNITDLRDVKVEGKRVDKAVELAKDHDSLDGFTKSVFKRANLRAPRKIESFHVNSARKAESASN